MSDVFHTRRPSISARMLIHEMEVYHESAFMEALVAAYVLVSHADGDISPRERRRLMIIARTEPRLAAFSHEEIASEFAMHEENYRSDNEVASEIATEKIALMCGKRRESIAIINACRLAIPADGIAHPSEFRALTKVKTILHLNELDSLAA